MYIDNCKVEMLYNEISKTINLWMGENEYNLYEPTKIGDNWYIFGKTAGIVLIKRSMWVSGEIDDDEDFDGPMISVFLENCGDWHVGYKAMDSSWLEDINKVNNTAIRFLSTEMFTRDRYGSYFYSPEFDKH